MIYKNRLFYDLFLHILGIEKKCNGKDMVQIYRFLGRGANRSWLGAPLESQEVTGEGKLPVILTEIFDFVKTQRIKTSRANNNSAAKKKNKQKKIKKCWLKV